MVIYVPSEFCLYSEGEECNQTSEKINFSLGAKVRKVVFPSLYLHGKYYDL